MNIRFFGATLIISVVLLPVILPATLSAPADPLNEYCEREMAETADYCVEQERDAQERIEAGGVDPFILSSCRETFPESYAMQEACITIKEDQMRGLGPLRPGVNL